MAQNQVYLIKSGENSFVEETQAIVGISGGKVGIGTTHPEADLHVTGSVKVGGDLTVDGTLTTINSSTVSVDDINIELGSTDNPTDITAEGGGITVKGNTDKTFNWYAASGWTSSENLSVADGRHFAGDELRALDADGLSLFDTNQSGITIKGGKVGIHQTAPAYDLDVNGSGNFGSLYVGGNAVLTGEGSIFGKWEDGVTEGEIFYTGGNVGVGTTNPEHNFHVVGNGVVDGNFVVNGTSGTFNVGEFDVSGSNITLNSAGGGLDSSRGGLIVNGDSGTGKLEYLDSTQTWQSNQDVQIVADKHLKTDKVRAIDAEGLYLQDAGENGIYIQDGGNVNIAKQVNVVGLTKADGGLNVGNGKFNIQSDGTLGSVNPNADDVIKWDGTKWVAAVSPGGGGGGTSEVPNALINSLISGESIQQITYGPYDSTPKIATDLEIVGDGSVIPYALSGVSETGYFAVFSQEIPNNNYKIHTVFGGKDVYWETGSSSSIYYNDGDVSLQRNLTIGGNLTVAGSTTSINTQTLEIEDHNIVIASNTGYNQLTDVYPVGGDYAGVFWGTGDAGAASPVSLTYQSNKGFAFEGGNVGIGTTNPGAKLEVFQDLDTSSGASILKVTNTRLNTGSSSSVISLITDEVDGNTADERVQLAGSYDGTNGGKLDILTNNGSSLSPAVTIKHNGNVGIGTTSPETDLDIFSAVKPIIRLTGTGNNAVNTNFGEIQFYNRDGSGDGPNVAASIHAQSHSSTGSGGSLVFSTENAAAGVEGQSAEPRMTILSNGNVGIGTTSPDYKLQVGGTNVSHTNDIAAIFAGTTPGAGDKVGIQFGTDLQSGASRIYSYVKSTNNSDLAFEVKDDSTFSEAMRINSSGHVGIGATSPVGKLHVTDLNVSIGNVDVTNNGADVSGGTDLNTKISDGDRIKINGEIFTVSAVAAETLTLSGTPLTAGTFPAYTDSNGLVVTSAGNVGIGTTNPGAKLEVVGNSVNVTNSNAVYANSNQGLNGSLLLRNEVGSGGVAGNNVGIVFQNYSTGNSFGRISYIASVQELDGVRYSNLVFGTDDGTGDRDEKMRITSAGRVGIGTTNPGTNKLYVSGNIYASGTITPSSDDRVKHNEQPIVGALETLSKITPKKYIKTTEMYDANHDFELDADGNPIDENGKPVEHTIEAGVIAQQVLTVDELAFAVSPEGVDEDGTVTSPHGLDYNSLFTYAIAAIQEQQQLIDDLKSQNESLAARISALES